jgi:Sec-independent protein secretion pathway component TatC
VTQTLLAGPLVLLYLLGVGAAYLVGAGRSREAPASSEETRITPA